MKYTQRKIVVLAAFLVIAVSGIVWAGSSAQMAKDYGGNAIQVITPPATSPVTTIAAAGNITVSAYTVVMFDEEVEIYWGSDSSNSYTLPANTPLGIGVGVATVHVDTACSMLHM